MKILLLVVLLLTLVMPCFAQVQTTDNLQLRLIFMKFADPVDIAFLFGGEVVQGGGMSGGSGNSGGGYGGSSGYGGNSSSGYGGNSSRGSRNGSY